MAKESRSLENALNMTPELSSFLDGPDDKPKKKASPKKQPKAAGSSPRKMQEPKPVVNARVSFSTRIRADIASKLFAVASKRKLANAAPWSLSFGRYLTSFLGRLSFIRHVLAIDGQF